MTLTLYTRRGCHLCEEMILDIHSLAPADPPELELVDVDLDPRALARFGDRVPVLARGETVLCEGRLSAGAREKILEK